MIYLEIVAAEVKGSMRSRTVTLSSFLIHSDQEETYIRKTDDPKVAVTYLAQAMIDRKENGLVFPGVVSNRDDLLVIETKEGKSVEIPRSVFDTPADLPNDTFKVMSKIVSVQRSVQPRAFIIAGHTWRAEKRAEEKSRKKRANP